MATKVKENWSVENRQHPSAAEPSFYRIADTVAKNVPAAAADLRREMFDKAQDKRVKGSGKNEIREAHVMDVEARDALKSFMSHAKNKPYYDKLVGAVKNACAVAPAPPDCLQQLGLQTPKK